MPAFSSSVFNYTATVPMSITTTQVTPTANDSEATITVNGAVVNSGMASSAITLNAGLNTISVIVTAEDGVTTETYPVDVIREASYLVGDIGPGGGPVFYLEPSSIDNSHKKKRPHELRPFQKLAPRARTRTGHG